MKNRYLLILTLAVVIILGMAAYSSTRKDVSVKNSDMLAKGGVAVKTESVNYFGNARGLYAEPAVAGVYPGVVMIHENRGLRPEIRQMAAELAREGYRVLAVDLFGGRVVETQDEARALTAGFDRAEGIENMKAAVAYLKQRGAGSVASLGWCFGGGQSLALALSGEPLNATVIYYGVGLATTTTALAPVSWPVLGIFGDQDQAISVETVRLFEAALDARGIENEIYVYPGVGHAFANPSGQNYAPDATKDAWAKTLAFLKDNLK